MNPTFAPFPRLGFTALALCAAATTADASSMSPVTAGLIFAADAQDVTLTGGSISSLNDQSGLGNNAAQATAANRPTLTTGATQGGTDAIDFNGTDQVLEIAATSTFDSGAITAYLVYSPDDNTNGRIISNAYNDVDPGVGTQYSGQAWAPMDGSNNRFRALVRDSGNGFHAANTPTNSAPQGTDFLIGGLVYDSTNSTTDNILAILINDDNTRFTGTEAAYDSDPNPLFQDHQLTRIGGDIDFSNPANSGVLNNLYNGQIAEILIYNRVLTDVELGQVESYLYNKHLIPEPGAMTLLAAGAGLILARRRR